MCEFIGWVILALIVGRILSGNISLLERYYLNVKVPKYLRFILFVPTNTNVFGICWQSITIIVSIILFLLVGFNFLTFQLACSIFTAIIFTIFLVLSITLSFMESFKSGIATTILISVVLYAILFM